MMTGMTSSIHFITILLFTSCFVASAQQQRKQQETTCSWGGQIFQRGESLGSSFVTRCGDANDYPCYCNPDMNPPIECPYCSFVVKSESSSASSNLLCAGDGEIVTFMHVTGIEKTCECSASPGETPTPNCDLPNPDNGVDDTTSTCTIDLPDGTSRVFNAGESIEDFLPNRCGTDFPCFCNPNVQGQIECPYCRFTTLNGNGLKCARDGETVSFQDLTGVDQTCSCQLPEGGEHGEAIVNCSVNDEEDGGTKPSPTPSPTPPLSNDPQTDICTLDLPTGQTITFQNGESYGDYLPPTRCGSTSDFPCYCNPAFPNQIECPYCGYVHGNNDELITCSKDGETISFKDEADGVTRTCSCEIPDDPSLEPIQNCDVGTLPPTSAPIFTPPPIPEPTPPTDNENVCTVLDFVSGGAEEVIIPDGESFGDHFEGACGNAAFWPAFCDAGSSNNNDEQGSDSKVSRQRAGVDATARSVVVVGDVVYPYCIFEDALDGGTVCARSNGAVTYVNKNKIEVTCDCLYLSPALGGAQSNCRETSSGDGTIFPPTESPDDDVDEENSKSSSPNQLAAIWSTAVITVSVAAGTML